MQDLQSWLRTIDVYAIDEFGDRVYLPLTTGEMKKLFLNNNQISELPESIGILSNLQRLYLQYNQISELPESIGKLSKLEWLHLQHNQISVLPEFIGKMSNLQILWLHNNQIRELPESIGNLRNLQALHLGYNQIRKLPNSICKLKRTVLYLEKFLTKSKIPHLLQINTIIPNKNVIDAYVPITELL